MSEFLAVALGGAIGAGLRFLLSEIIPKKFLATLTVNLLGSFAIGLLYALLVEELKIPTPFKVFLITGFLGGFTTFSTFAYESSHLILSKNLKGFLLYFLTTNFVGILAVLIGYSVGEKFKL